MTTPHSQSDVHWAPTSYHWTGKPVGIVQWRGCARFQEARAAGEEEFYGNWHVFGVTDRIRMAMFVGIIVFCTLKAHFATDLLISANENSAPYWLLRVPEFALYASALLLLVGILSVRKSYPSASYRVAEFMLNKWYNRTPPYIPCDMRAGNFQIAVVGISILFFSAGVNLALDFSDVTVSPKDEDVAHMQSSLYNLWFAIFLSLRGYCPIRGWLAGAMAAGWIKAPPTHWAGLEMCACSFAAMGPNVEHVGDKIYVQPDWTLKQFVTLVLKNYMTCPMTQMGTMLIWTCPFQAMLLTWHKSEATMVVAYTWFVLNALWTGYISSTTVMFLILGRNRRMRELGKTDGSRDTCTSAQVQECVVVSLGPSDSCDCHPEPWSNHRESQSIQPSGIASSGKECSNDIPQVSSQDPGGSRPRNQVPLPLDGSGKENSDHVPQVCSQDRGVSRPLNQVLLPLDGRGKENSNRVPQLSFQGRGLSRPLNQVPLPLDGQLAPHSRHSKSADGRPEPQVTAPKLAEALGDLAGSERWM